MSISCEGANEYLKELIKEKILSDYNQVDFKSIKVNQITRSFLLTAILLVLICLHLFL